MHLEMNHYSAEDDFEIKMSKYLKNIIFSLFCVLQIVF